MDKDYLKDLLTKVNGSATYDIEDVLRELGSKLDAEPSTLAGLSPEKLNTVLKITEKIGHDLDKAKSIMDTSKFNELDGFIKAINARVNRVSLKKMADLSALNERAKSLKADFDELTKEIIKVRADIMQAMYVAGDRIQTGVKNYDFDAEKFTVDEKRDDGTHASFASAGTTNVGDFDSVASAAMRTVYLTDEDIRNLKADTKAKLDSYKKNADRVKAAKEEKLRLVTKLEDLVLRREQIRTELLTVNEDIEARMFDTDIEGYDAEIDLADVSMPKEKDKNADIKKLHDDMLSAFSKTMGSVKSFEDMMKLPLDDLRDLVKDLKGLNAKGPNSFNQMVKTAEGKVGSDPEARAILADMKKIRDAFYGTKRIAEKTKSFKNASLNNMTDARKEFIEKHLNGLEELRVEKEEEVLKEKYILGLVDDKALTKFAKANKRSIIALNSLEAGDKKKIAAGETDIKESHERLLQSADVKLTELTSQVEAARSNVEIRTRLINDLKNGVLNPAYEKMVNNNRGVLVGEALLDEMRSGVTREVDFERLFSTEATFTEEPEKEEKAEEGLGDGPAGGSGEGGSSEGGSGEGEPSEEDKEVPTTPGGTETKEEEEEGMDKREEPTEGEKKGKGKGKAREAVKKIGKLIGSKQVLIAALCLASGIGIGFVFSGAVGSAVTTLAYGATAASIYSASKKK